MDNEKTMLIYGFLGIALTILGSIVVAATTSLYTLSKTDRIAGYAIPPFLFVGAALLIGGFMAMLHAAKY